MVLKVSEKMSVSKRISAVKLYNYYQILLILICISHIKSEKISMSKEGLREEQLLPVRMTREVSEDGVEGSGDDDSTPIRSLRSRMMERMYLKKDDNNVLDESNEEARSKEVMEEGSGFGDTTTRSAAALSIEANNTAEAFDEDTTEEKDLEDVEIITKEDTETTTESKVTEISLDATTMKEETTLDTTTAVKIQETTTEAISFTDEVTTTIKEEVTESKEVTVLPVVEEGRTEAEVTTTKPETTTVVEEPKAVTEVVEVKHVKPVFAAETTTMVEEPKAVTEVVEVKHVKPVFAAETTTKVPEEEEEEAATTTHLPAVIVPDNVTLIVNENLTAGTDTLLMKINSKLLDAKETITESSKDPSRLGTYIVISLILLSFLSLIGFILMKRRVQKRRKKSGMDPDTLDTEKALLSLSEYKDHPDGVDEGKIKNNEITPIVIKSNAKINKFEKNTNFSSPKNLNTKANEKNVEKDNVLKKTSDNLTHVIIEDPAKDVDEEKAPTNAEKLIVRTHLDQDSIPKKAVLINRTSLGCVPVSPQD